MWRLTCNPCCLNTDIERLPWFWSHPGLHGVFWTSLGYRVRTCLEKKKKKSQTSKQTRREIVVQIDAWPAFISSLIVLSLIQLRSSCTWKNEVLPPSKLSLFNNSEDQQKNSSSFANVSWCPVKSGHLFHAWSVPLWFVRSRSLFPCSSSITAQWCLCSFDSFVLTKLTGNCPKIL